MATTPARLKKAFKQLRDAALQFPQVNEDFPWGESAFKIAQKKVFCFMRLSDRGDEFSLSCKLPQSQDVALMLPFAQPAGYGLGKAGWVTATFDVKKAPPVELLREWLTESYFAVAPKKLSALISEAPAVKSPKRK